MMIPMTSKIIPPYSITHRTIHRSRMALINTPTIGNAEGEHWQSPQLSQRASEHCRCSTCYRSDYPSGDQYHSRT